MSALYISDWPSNCQHLPSCDIKDPAAYANRTARRLREREKCDLVIALTHMRLEEDIAVSKNTQAGSGRIDLLLGGHDHVIVQRATTDSDTNPNVAREGFHPSDDPVLLASGDVHIVKSGTDWRGLSILHLSIAKYSKGILSILRVKRKCTLRSHPPPFNLFSLSLFSFCFPSYLNTLRHMSLT